MFRKIHNSDQNAANTVKLYSSESGCCSDGQLPQCMYDVTIPTANAVNSITFKDSAGASKTVTFSPAVTGATDVKAAIKAAIVAEGYEDDADVVSGVTSEAVSTNTIYSITGELVIDSMVHNTSTSVNAVAKCTRVANCQYAYADYAAVSTDLTINGVVEDLGTITPGTTSAGAVATAIETALGNQSVAFDAVTVITTGSGAGTLYQITITGVLSTTTLSLDGLEFTRSACSADYVA